MGVKGLWQLIEPAGRPITLERLEGKRLAVDVSIWLNKAAKGMRDKFGNPVHNGHLLMMFQRICKLLFYKIKPIFVFDGGVPELKKRTLLLRKDRRLEAHLKAGKAREKMIQNYVQSVALGVVTGRKSAEKLTKEKEPDLFELPALPSGSLSSDSSSEELEYVEREKDLAEDFLSGQIEEHLQSVDDIDINSEDFKLLPPEVQHELLVELKESHRKKYNRKKYEKMPENADDFSSYQLEGLLRRGQITKQIDDVRKTMSSKSSGEVMEMCGEEAGNKNREVEARRVVSEPKSHYILIKSTPNQGGNTMFAGISEKHEETVGDEETESEHFQKLERKPHQFKEMYLDEVTTTVFISESSDEGGLVSPQRLTEFDFRTPALVTHGYTGLSEYQSDTGVQREGKFNEPHNISYSGSTEVLAPRSTSLSEDRKVHEIFPLHTKNTTEENVEAMEEMTDVVIPTVTPSDMISSMTEHERATSLKGKTSENALSMKAATLGMSIETESVKNPSTEEVGSKSTVSEISDAIDLTEDGHDIKGFKADVGHVLDSPSSQSLNIMRSNLQDSGKEVRAVNQVPSSAVLTDEDRKRIEEFQRNVEGKSKDDISEMQDDLEKERKELDKERQKLTRAATSVVDEMYNDVQELLRLFGIPFLISPMEAEAQCAALDGAGLTEGSITDDSDIFLFGGRRVYKNIFNQNRYAEFYSSKDIETMLFLDRHKMIALAYLTGSDYTEGIHGVGGVTAVEILQEFPGEPIDTLQRIREWFNDLDRRGPTTQETKIKTKMRNMTLPPGFPNPHVFEAYINPVVDSSDEPFEWGSPDLGAIRDFARDKLNWRMTQTDEVLLPVLQRLNAPESQSKLTSFFPSLSKPAKKQSKRVQRVLDLIRSKSGDNEVDQPAIPNESPSRAGKKRKNYETEVFSPGKGRVGEHSDSPINDKLTGNPCQGTSRDLHANTTEEPMGSTHNLQSRIPCDLLRGFPRRRGGRSKAMGGKSRLSIIKKQAAAITKLHSQPIMRKQLQPVSRVALSSSSDSE